MGQCLLYGNGGKDRLKLRIFGQTTPPPNPKNNDIWVNTSLPIGGWEFSEVSNPTWGTSISGFIYFTSTYSGAGNAVTSTGLNFLKEWTHAIYTKLLSCLQYDGSSWTRKDAYIYHDKWIQFSSVWDGTLFYNGNQYTNVTGGWTLNKFSLKDGAFDTGLTSETSGNDVMACTANKLDVGQFSTLHIQCYSNFKNSGGRGNARFGICNTNGLSYDNFAAYRDIDTGNNTLTEYSIDISSVTGAYYVKFYASVAYMMGWLKIAKMWLT